MFCLSEIHFKILTSFSLSEKYLSFGLYSMFTRHDFYIPLPATFPAFLFFYHHNNIRRSVQIKLRRLKQTKCCHVRLVGNAVNILLKWSVHMLVTFSDKGR
jgi:hypothetical protein